MNHLWKTFKLSVACCLILNLNIMQAVFTDGGAGSPAAAYAAGTSDPTQAQIDAYLAEQQSFFETLFATPWMQEDLSYSLATRIVGLGDYQGTNRAGQAFTLSVLWEQPLDLTQAGLPPQQLQQAIDEQVTVASVAGCISTALAEIPIIAIAISGFQIQDGQLVSYFVITNQADPNGPFLQGMACNGQPLTNPNTGSPPPTGPVFVPHVGGGNTIAKDCPDGENCSGGGPPSPSCTSLNQSLCNQCLNAHQNAIDSANAALQAAIAAANSNAHIANLAAIATFAVLMAKCSILGFFSFFIAAPVCALGVAATLSIAVIAIQATNSSSITIAIAAKNDAVAAADFARNQCISNFNCCENGCIACG